MNSHHDERAPRRLEMIEADAVTAVGYTAAADAIDAALTSGIDISRAPARTIVPVRAGQLLLMPGEIGEFTGVKIASVAPDNPAHGLPRIQGTFLLMDAATLTPIALIDGVALTNLRTPAVSAAAARAMSPHRVGRLVVVGAGPQAEGHIRALGEVLDVGEIVVISRDADHARDLVARLGGDLQSATRAPTRAPIRVGGAADLAEADIVVCATTAREPLFAAEAVRPGALVIAVGSHEPEARELPAELFAGAQVVVEEPGTALREAGDVIQACAAGMCHPASLITMGEVIAGAVTIDHDRTRVFKSVGMAWEDVAVAVGVLDAARRGRQ